MKKFLLIVTLFFAINLTLSSNGCKYYYLVTTSYYTWDKGNPHPGCFVKSESVPYLWQRLNNYTDVAKGASPYRYKMYWKIYSNCGTVSSAWWYIENGPITPIYCK